MVFVVVLDSLKMRGNFKISFVNFVSRWQCTLFVLTARSVVRRFDELKKVLLLYLFHVLLQLFAVYIDSLHLCKVSFMICHVSFWFLCLLLHSLLPVSSTLHVYRLLFFCVLYAGCFFFRVIFSLRCVVLLPLLSSKKASFFLASLSR